MSTKRKASPFTLHHAKPCTTLAFLEVLREVCPPECEFDALPAKPSPLGIVIRMKLGAHSFIGESALTTRANALTMAENFHKAAHDVAKQL